MWQRGKLRAGED